MGAPGRGRVEPRGQQERESGADADPALDADLPPVIAQNAVADAEAEARPLPDVARREERVEHATDVVLGNAMTRIADRELDGRSFFDIPRADPEAARRASAHRLFRVQHEVEQRLLELASVGEDAGKVRLVLGVELDAAQAELVHPQGEHAADEIDDVLRRTFGRLPPREREQISDDPGGALGLLRNPAQVTGERRGRPHGRLGRRGSELVFDELGVADHAGQRVVQLVCDARHELTDGRQFFGLEQLRLRRLQPIDGGDQPGVRTGELVAHPAEPPSIAESRA